MKLLRGSSRGSSRHRRRNTPLSPIITGAEVQSKYPPPLIYRTSHKARTPTVSVNLLNNETEANHSQVSQIQQSSPKQSQTNIITAKKRVLTRFLWVVFIILLLVGISLIITLVLQTQRRHQSSLWSDPIELPGKHFIFSKRLWKGVNASSTEPLEHPTPIVVISHTTGRRCNSFEDCSDVMRNTQDHHLSLRGQRSGDKVVDIGYNFLIGGDGNIYEGRGWDVRSFHRRPENVIGISFIGNYERFELTEDQIEAAQELLALGVKEQKLTTDYALVAHSQTIQTTSPGQNVVKVISKWSHWSPHLQIR